MGNYFIRRGRELPAWASTMPYTNKYTDMEYKDGKIVIKTFEELIDVMLNATPEQLDSIYQQIDEEIERQEKHDEDEIIRQELSN